MLRSILRKIKKLLGLAPPIPGTLEESFVELDKRLGEEDKKWIREHKENDMSGLHHGFGRWLRNNWGLWTGSKISEWFNEKGIKHADDMSGIILTSYWRHKHNEPIKLDEQIKYYQDYWKKVNKNGG